MKTNIITIPVQKVQGVSSSAEQDLLAVEEPLQLRLSFQSQGARRSKDLSITMRTPGHDVELAAGFLFTEGILQVPDQIVEIQGGGSGKNAKQNRNTVTVRLKRGVKLDWDRLERHFYLSSSCGVCGKASIEALQATGCPTLPSAKPLIDSSVIHRLPQTLRSSQALFDRTGGLHAAALFNSTGKLLSMREDVGRHNALDKLIGAEFLKNRLPLSNRLADRLLLLSGRTSFELVQKALMAGIPVLAAVGAPSSLAVELALRFQMTLVGFVRNDRFNIYSGGWRIQGV